MVHCNHTRTRCVSAVGTMTAPRGNEVVRPFLRLSLLLLILGLAASSDPADAPEASDEAGEVPEVVKRSEYSSPVVEGSYYLAEHFDDRLSFTDNWVFSEAKKEDIDEDIAKYDGKWDLEEPKRGVEKGNLGLVLKTKARHAAISTRLNQPFVFNDKPFIIQYEVIFQDGLDCGGAYLKLLSVDESHKNLRDFHDKTPYTIMFGPDKCGNDHKLHFIFRHKNPVNKTFEEKHAKKPKERLEEIFKDKQPHLYTLIIHPDNNFVIKVDGNVVNDGNLLDDFIPPVNPPLEIEDPDDKRPVDWDDREKIPDPTAKKPDDWDEDEPAQIIDEEDKAPDGWLENEPATIANPNAIKPNDWDDEMDGEWEPPLIENPKCADAPGCGPYQQRKISNPKFKGKWLAPLIMNPNYQGKWKARLIPNPDYFNDPHPFKMTTIYAIGFELWSMSSDILFDNIIITDDESVAKIWTENTFKRRKERIAEESSGLWQEIINFTADNPWIWTVYILMLGIPVILIIYCCCFTSQDTKEPQDEAEAEAERLLQKDKEEVDGEQEEEDEAEKVEESIESEDKDEQETDEVISENTKEPRSSNTEGARRRKPKKA